jgi:hypothetical protein
MGFKMNKSPAGKAKQLGFECFKDLEQLFGLPPIIHGEDAEAYRSIGQSIWDARPPEDIIQATRINDITYLLWEGGRLRRLKVKLIEASRVEGAKKLIKRIEGQYRDESFWASWALGGKDTVEYVNALLSTAGLDEDSIISQTVEAIVETLESIERQSAQFEARRLVAIRELEQCSESVQARKKQISAPKPKKSKQTKDLNEGSAPMLPLDLKAAE